MSLRFQSAWVLNFMQMPGKCLNSLCPMTRVFQQPHSSRRCGRRRTTPRYYRRRHYRYVHRPIRMNLPSTIVGSAVYQGPAPEPFRSVGRRHGYRPGPGTAGQRNMAALPPAVMFWRPCRIPGRSPLRSSYCKSPHSLSAGHDPSSLRSPQPGSQGYPLS